MEKTKIIIDDELKHFLSNYEEIIQREVTGFGTGAHIIVPQKHIGKEVTIIVHRK